MGEGGRLRIFKALEVLLAARISPETTDATTIPHNPQPLQYHNCLSRYGTTVKMKDLPNIWLLKRGRGSDIEAFGIISWTAETLQNFVPPLSVSETPVNKQLFVSYYKFADVQTSDHS